VGLAGPTSLAGWPRFGILSKIVSYTCQGRSVTPEVSEGREGWPAGWRPSAPNRLKCAVEILLTSYKYPPISLLAGGVKKVVFNFL
jgi:hypothetical protein